ncbi:sensor histidine kinase [Streptomyces sp. NPDC004296]|uniref:sensor histidine kinase n=1 Tax=Streptomyces sp. NPDC004296 TaxID=3364697 RepID=UPI0036977AF0
MHPARPHHKTSTTHHRLAPTVRVRLTALYGALFLLSGTLLLTVVYLFLDGIPVTVSGGTEPGGTAAGPSTPDQLPGPAGAIPPPPDAELEHIAAQAKAAMLNHLLTVSAIALVLLALLAVFLGWWMAGHVLRPVHRITTTARRLSWQNLHERIALAGPRDEFKELADTFDDLLARLESAFDSQRRFIANASHELRTPLTIQRAAIQIALADAASSPQKLATVQEQLLDANRRAERLIDGLLLLAQSDRGPLERVPVALENKAAEAADLYASTAQAADVTINTDLHPVTVLGDPVLLTHLIANLVQNAIRHNHRGGSVDIHLSATAGLIIRNTGPHVPAQALPDLFEPFHRLGTARTGSAQGAGLGLSIVSSIAQAHSGSVTAHPNPGGGLKIRISLPHLTDAPLSAGIQTTSGAS